MYEYLNLTKGRIQDSFQSALREIEKSVVYMNDDAYGKVTDINADLGTAIGDKILTEEERDDLHTLSIELDHISSQLSDIADLFDPDLFPDINTLRDADNIAFEYQHAIKTYTQFCEMRDIFYNKLNQAKERNHA